MKSTRRLLSIILCLIMCLSLLPMSAFADDGIIASGDANPGDPGKVEFVLYKSGKLVVSGYGEVAGMEHWSFSNFTGYASADDARKATMSETRTLAVEEGITRLDDFSFYTCPNLASVSLPNSLTEIGWAAFYGASSLNKITIPGNVTLIEGWAFGGNISLASVVLSTGLQEIGINAFRDCTKLSSIVIPANVSIISGGAFADCGSLKTVTFKGNLVNNLIDPTAFTGVTADIYYPVDNNGWNMLLDSQPGYPDFGGRLTWKANAAASSGDGWVTKNGDWYFYVGGKMLVNSWKAYGGEWFYFGADGKMVTGRVQIDGDYYYFGTGGTKDPKLGARYSGLQGGEYYGEDGKWQPAYNGVDDSGLDYYTDGWQQVNGKWFFIRNRAKVTGWLWRYDYWYYLDPTTGAMVTGWLTWNGNTYYLRPLDKAIDDGLPDREGSMIAGRSSEIGGVVYTFDQNGALLGGKIDENPLGLQNGFRKEGPDWYFYRSNGVMVTGWELVNNTWYLFGSNGKMLTGWQYVGGKWYYLTPVTGTGDPKTSDTGKMVTGFQTIPYTKNGDYNPKTYYFTGSGALNGTGWIQVGLKWYYLEKDGVVATGWFRDGTKWYFLRDDTSPIGEMVTGEYTVPSKFSPNGKQYFLASGEWTGNSNPYNQSTAGSWQEHDGGWYYHDANGNALTGWQQVGGKWYYLNPSSSPAGKMVTGWQNIDGRKFYFESSGALLGGWQKIDGVWYYLYPDHDGQYGALLTGWQLSNGKWYFLDETTGAMQDGWIKRSDGWYYLNEDQYSNTYGAMQEGGWKEINGKWYYFHDVADGHFGMLEQGKWIHYKDNWYYVKESSDPAESWMVTGLQTIDSKIFYFNSDGVMQTGWKELGSKWYYFHEAADGNQGRAHTDTFGGDVDGWGFNADGTAYQK